ELVIAHVGALPRSVHGEVPKYDEGQSTLLGKGPAQVLAGELRDAIGRNRTRRQGLVSATMPSIHRRCRHVKEALEAAQGARRLQQAEGRADVAALVQVELGPAFREPGHRRKVKYNLNPIHGLAQIVGAKIERVPGEARVIAELGKIALLDDPGIVG